MAKADKRLASKPNPLAAVLKADTTPAAELPQQEQPSAPEPVREPPKPVQTPPPRKRRPRKMQAAPAASASTRPSSRMSTSMIGGHFPQEAKKRLGLIAVEEDTTKQALLEEALNLLFERYGKKPVDFGSDE